MVPLEWAYLFGSTIFLIVWVVLYALFPSTRKEMLIFSLGIGVLSVCTSYYWWTHDWWHPLTITGTKVGVEDFIAGFGSGGVMAVVYEGLFKKRYYKRKSHHHCPGAFTLLLLMAFLTSWLFWGVGITSFWASTLALLVIAGVMFYYRRDLLANGVLSGVLMVAFSLLPYFAIMFVSPDWIAATYNYQYLSGIHLIGIPVEELAFWFLAGLVFGPFYEYWQGEYLRRSQSRKAGMKIRPS